MIAFDTNVVVRLLVEDDPKQLAAARRTLEAAIENDEPVLLTEVVLSELEWVLESAYGVPRGRILEALQTLAGDPRFTFQDAALLREALNCYQAGKGDLSDYLAGLRAAAEGAATTYTFDQSVAGEAAFTLVRTR